jgi:hypothetical protein
MRVGTEQRIRWGLACVLERNFSWRWLSRLHSVLRSVGQDIPRLVCSPKVYCLTCGRYPGPVHFSPHRYILYLQTRLNITRSPTFILPIGFIFKLSDQNLYTYIFSFLYTACPAPCTLLCLVSLILLSEEYEIYGSSFPSDYHQTYSNNNSIKLTSCLCGNTTAREPITKWARVKERDKVENKAVYNILLIII